MAKNKICLWYERDAEEAARFYAETFPDSSVGAVHPAPADYPDCKAGDALTVEFILCNCRLPTRGQPVGSTPPRLHLKHFRA